MTQEEKLEILEQLIFCYSILGYKIDVNKLKKFYE
jgi:hypothetical protein